MNIRYLCPKAATRSSIVNVVAHTGLVDIPCELADDEYVSRVFVAILEAYVNRTNDIFLARNGTPGEPRTSLSIVLAHIEALEVSSASCYVIGLVSTSLCRTCQTSSKCWSVSW